MTLWFASSKFFSSLCDEQGFSFQIGYCEVDDQLPGRSIPQYTLYLTVANEKERVDWIRALRAGKLIEPKISLCIISIDVKSVPFVSVGILKKNTICK